MVWGSNNTLEQDKEQPPPKLHSSEVPILILHPQSLDQTTPPSCHTIEFPYTYFYGEFLSLELEGQIQCVGMIAGQRIQTWKLGDVKETCSQRS